MNACIENRIIWLVCFFLASGYRIFLMIILYLGLEQYSRYYSIPIRILLVSSMIYFLIKKGIRSTISTFIFFLFSFIYILKIFLTEINGVYNLSLNWFEYLFYYITFGLVPFLFFSNIDFDKHHRKILKSFILSGFIFSILVVFLYQEIIFSGELGRLARVNEDELTISPLALSYTGVLTISLCLYELFINRINKSKKNFLYLLTNIFLGLLLMILGASRGAIVVLALVLVLIISYSKIGSKIRLLFLLLLISPIIVFFIQKTGSSIIERTNSTIYEGNTSNRDALYNESINEFVNNPVLGGSIEVSGIYPHNIILEVLMSTGLIGFMLFIYLIITASFIVKKKSKEHFKYIIIMIFLTNSFIQHQFSGGLYAAAFLYLSLGLIFSINKKVSKLK